MRAGVLDVGIWNPGEHFLALGKHLLGCSIEIREHFDGNPSVSHERRNALHDLLVFVFLFFRAQGVAGCNELLNLRIFGNQRWIRGLAIHKPEQALDPERLIGVAAVDQNFRFRPVCRHAVHLERFFFLFDPAIPLPTTSFNIRQNLRFGCRPRQRSRLQASSSSPRPWREVRRCNRWVPASW